MSFGIVGLGGGAEEADATFADTPACVTTREARAFELGMRKRQVHRIADSKGWPVARETQGRHTFMEREYKACWSRQRDVHVWYVNNRVFAMQVDWGWWQ